MDQRLSTKRGFLSAPGARLAAAGAFALSVFASAPASASPSYPEAVQEFFAIAATPSCKLCHATDDGGPGRLNNFVGMYVRYDLGLEAGAGADA
ncbi:MAG TPA: hypothetical protein VFS00_21655, partial [Polyangiaceae bacterium]|nr:hypothetical protein [Polyangiaceae bacterium]